MICLIRTIKRTLYVFFKIGLNGMVSGHDYALLTEGDSKQVLKCKTCGKLSIG